MKVSTLHEFTIRKPVQDVIDAGLDDLWGGTLQRYFERFFGQERRQAYYFASVVAEQRNLAYIVVNDRGRPLYISAQRIDDNSPKETQAYWPSRTGIPDEAEGLAAIGSQGLIPPAIESMWLENGSENEKAAAELQNTWRAGKVASSADDNQSPESGEEIVTTTLPGDSEEVISVADDGGTIEVVGDITGLDDLIDFATSGKGGLANDYDQKPAITQLQQFLVNLGLNVGNNGPDGLYGRKTTAAVRSFQSAIKDLAVDGDAGPQTIQAISIVEADLLRMQELVDRHLSESFTYKSNLAKLLEADLTDAETAELQELIDKYKDFSTEFPNFMDGLYTKAQEAAAGVQTFPLDNDEVVSTGNNDGSDAEPEVVEPEVVEPEVVEPDDSIDWSKIIVAPPEKQTDDDLILLKQTGLNSFYAVKAQKYANRAAVPVAFDSPELQTFTNFTIPERLFNDINSEMDRRTPKAVPVEVPAVRNDNDFVPAENPRAAELRYQLLKTNTTPPQFKYIDPNGHESQETFATEAAAMEKIERMAELRRKAGLINR